MKVLYAFVRGAVGGGAFGALLAFGLALFVLGEFHAWMVWACAAVGAIGAVIVERLPSPHRRGGYVPGMTPNPHVINSPEWLAHEHRMQQERQTEHLGRIADSQRD
ncbi:hypothetical protein [Microbacterium album]|uniref:Uncharacterized protein n=1 Tax=Microbacterium album TaxID=2053191 RepID=A0A917MMD5_9MICO|nr:hypothetical protein [Microbacterium album]GGH34315.1 hypothetical protein GCM10010921_01930 [Microbacterium album]